MALQVIDKKPQYLEMAGNLVPISKTEDQLNIVFRAFTENRLAFPVRIRDPTREPTARLSFMREPREDRAQTPVCSVVVTLPEFTPESVTDDSQTKTCECPICVCCLEYRVWHKNPPVMFRRFLKNSSEFTYNYYMIIQRSNTRLRAR